MVQFRRDWFNQMDMIQQEMNRLLDHFAGAKPPQVRFSPQIWEPAIDVFETEDNLVVIIELAGVKESEINLVVGRETFTIQGCRRKSIETGEKRAYHRMEIASGLFRRSIALPVAVDIDEVKASYENGLVEVILQKEKKRGTHKIDIKTRPPMV
jgi:HSP20 family protein